MKLSLRTQKLTSSNSLSLSEHSDRTTSAESVDSTKSHLNNSFKSEHYQKDTEQLWNYIKSDFQEKKAQGLILKNKRFLKRTSTKITKDKSGAKTSSQVETSIQREFVIQIGNEEDGFLSKEKSLIAYKKIMKKIAEKYKLSILQYDLHADEKVPHLHFFATQYNFDTGEFSKEFNKPNSYAEMQEDIFKYANEELKLNLDDYEKKTCIDSDYIAPKVYKKNMKIIKKAKEYCKKKDENEKTIESLNSKIDTTLNDYTDEISKVEYLENENEILSNDLEKEKLNLIKYKKEVENYVKFNANFTVEPGQKFWEKFDDTMKNYKDSIANLNSEVSNLKEQLAEKEVENKKLSEQNSAYVLEQLSEFNSCNTTKKPTINTREVKK